MALRDIIPSLSMMAEKATDDTDPQEPSRKLNKVRIDKAFMLATLLLDYLMLIGYFIGIYSYRSQGLHYISEETQ